VSLRETSGVESVLRRAAAGLERRDLKFGPRGGRAARACIASPATWKAGPRVSGRFRHEAITAADFPAVGDWVGVEGAIHSRPPGAAERRVARAAGRCGGAAGGARERRHDFSGHRVPRNLNAGASSDT